MLKCQFSDLRERDMDLLLMEEIASCQKFANIFLSLISLVDAKVVSVEQSKTDENGESDITVVVEKDGIKYGLLIENKIDAKAQPAQASRYHKRGDEGVRKGDYQTYQTFIVAPQRYLDNNAEAKHYDWQVSYEVCLAYFALQTDGRAIFKRQQIEQAIDKQKRGYQPTVDDAVTDFWMQYRDYQRQSYRELCIKGDCEGKPSKSTWVYFDTSLKNICIIHKAAHGIVDVEFSGLGERWQTLRSFCQSTFGNLFDARLTVEQTGKSAVLRSMIPMTPINMQEPFVEQKDTVDIALREVCRLRRLIEAFPTVALYSLWNNEN